MKSTVNSSLYYTEETQEELREMMRNDMIVITPESFLEMIAEIGYKIDESMSFCYINNMNERTYLARSISYTCLKCGNGFANESCCKENLKELQKIRSNYVVYDGVRIWEL